MLSRVAEALFWVGRYVERADDTSRLLDVSFHQTLEDPTVDEESTYRLLVGVMGAAEPVTRASELLDLLAYDPRPSAIAGALEAARENARGAREALSAEMWECLNTTHHELGGRVSAARDFGPAPFFSWVRERAALLHGLADSTMSRDAGFDFLVLGRSVERVDMTARLLAARVGAAGATGGGWTATLRACSAHEAYLRTYQRGVEPLRVLEFLLLDRLFPRSVIHALGVGEEALARLDPTAGRVGPGGAARIGMGRARTDLEFLPAERLVDNLSERLHVLQRSMAEVTDAVRSRFFSSTGVVAYHLEEAPA